MDKQTIQSKPPVALGQLKTDQQKNVVDKILKNKNRFRSGLGFKQNKSNKEEEKARISQTVSRRKILQGTKADKNANLEAEDVREEETVPQMIEIELGGKNFNAADDVDENISLSKQAEKHVKKFYNPRQAFLEIIKTQKEESHAKIP